MTLTAERYGLTGVKVRVTSGPVDCEVREDRAHVREFWANLGRLLDEIDHDQHGYPTS